jgi:hypothetical protein
MSCCVSTGVGDRKPAVTIDGQFSWLTGYRSDSLGPTAPHDEATSARRALPRAVKARVFRAT